MAVLLAPSVKIRLVYGGVHADRKVFGIHKKKTGIFNTVKIKGFWDSQKKHRYISHY